jgi:predicted outer membrane repeat protein
MHRVIRQAFLVAMLIGAATTASAHAAIVTVDIANGADEYDVAPMPGSPCSLREAVQSIDNGANFGGCVADLTTPYGTADTIVLQPNTFTLTRTGGSPNDNATGDLDITKSVSIVGAGDQPGGTQIDANNIDRAFDVIDNGVAGAVNLGIIGVGIANGDTALNGGAIQANDPQGVLSVQGSTIADSSAGGVGGAIARGPTTTGTTNISTTEFDGNTADDDGGAIFRPAPTSGGVVLNVTQSLFSDNTSGGAGGAVYEQGPGENEAIYSNDTFSGNSAVAGGGAVALGTTSPTANLLFDTFSGNSTTTAAAGGAIHADSATEFVYVNNTIFDNNFAAGVDSACGGPTATFSPSGARDYNIDSGTGNTCILPTAVANHNLLGVDPLLAPLAVNSLLSQTRTQGLYDGSPAIDHGPASCASIGSVDQRGVSRPIGAACDTGAFEGSVGPKPPPTTGGGPPATTTPGPTGLRAAALKKCKKKHGKKRKKCKKKANTLPV